MWGGFSRLWRKPGKNVLLSQPHSEFCWCSLCSFVTSVLGCLMSDCCSLNTQCETQYTCTSLHALWLAYFFFFCLLLVKSPPFLKYMLPNVVEEVLTSHIYLSKMFFVSKYSLCWIASFRVLTWFCYLLHIFGLLAYSQYVNDKITFECFRSGANLTTLLGSLIYNSASLFYKWSYVLDLE